MIFLFRILRKTRKLLNKTVSKHYTLLLFKLNRVIYNRDFKTNGVPIVKTTQDAEVRIGSGFRMNNGDYHNMIGRQQRCYFVAHGNLTIGENVGISSTAIVCQNRIDIGDGVRIGGNTVIYDTDFHSLDPFERTKPVEDRTKIRTKPVTIDSNAFIGGHTTILKGVTIGKNAIVGAGSVVARDVPANQIWAGNPAKYIRDL